MKLMLTLFIFLSSQIGLSAIQSEAEFLAITARFEKELAPTVLEHFKQPLIVTTDWKKEYSRTSSGGSFYFPRIEGKVHRGVHVVGWLARFESMSSLGLNFVLCHELGHHFHGGAKEDDADYFAASECLKKLYSDEQIMQAYEEVALLRVFIWTNLGLEFSYEMMNECRREVVRHALRNEPHLQHCI